MRTDRRGQLCASEYRRLKKNKTMHTLNILMMDSCSSLFVSSGLSTKDKEGFSQHS